MNEYQVFPVRTVLAITGTPCSRGTLFYTVGTPPFVTVTFWVP